MRVDLFDFDLPEELIALRPASPRDSAQLLCVDRAGQLSDGVVTDLPGLLQPGDALVFNDTRVIPARLTGERLRGDGTARIEATLHMRLDADRWKAFLRPAKKVRIGETIRFDGDVNGDAALEAVIAQKGEAGEVDLVFDRAGPALDAALYAVGHMPLPPYIASKRGEDERDARDYQTVYAREDGAVAAPTAGLHFTDALLKAFKDRGIDSHFLTLHVGAGTFLPVKSEDTDGHKMHAEIGHVSGETAEALNAVRARGGRIVSVGTTSLRLLESAADADGRLHAWSGATDIFITPGYRFRFVDALMTNFHLPRSTLFMLVCAFSGYDTMRAAYDHAIAESYRFYSYGDSSLLWRAEDTQ